ncbi:MAG: TrkH family potassium uptake protein [Desulfurococcaceae archaeon]
MLRLIVILEEVVLIISLLGILMITVPLIDVIYGEPPSTWFLVLGLTYSVLGFASYKLITHKYKPTEPGLLESLCAYSLIWLLVPALSSIAMSLEALLPFEDAFFESVSGFTGTGLTIMRNLDSTKKGLLFWRGLMQWTGELGFVVFAAVIMPFFWRFGYILYSIERPVRISASLRKTAKSIFYMYSVITVVGIVICIYLGVEPLDAVVHTMTAIATGGMSTYDSNYQRVFEYAPLSIYPITALMILGGTSFVIIGYLLSGEFRRAWRNVEFRAYMVLCVFFTLLSTLAVLPRVNWSLEKALTTGGFNALSALTTTGFNIGSVGELPPELKLILTLAMFIGGMSFATVGGIKVVRLVVLVSKFKSHVLKMITGGLVAPSVKLGDEVLDEHEVSSTVLFVFVHLFIVLLGAGLIKSILPGIDFVDAFFEATSAASAVGLSTGVTSQHIPLSAKIVLISLMYLGRLEYIPLLTLIGIVVARKYRVVLK